MHFLRYTYGDRRKVEEIGSRDTGDVDLNGLVPRAIAGDLKAFEKIYDIFLTRIYRYVYYHIKDKMEAEDLTQQIFMKMSTAIDKYEQRDQIFSSWVFRIAHNHMIDYYRNATKENEIKQQIVVESEDPEKKVEDRLRQEEIMQAISGLTDLQKEVIILKFIEGLDNHRIAEMIGKNEGAIRIAQMRGLMALRKKLGTEEDL
jgi:RNA polymerase sigma-70 factor, ECF subfamily